VNRCPTFLKETRREDPWAGSNLSSWPAAANSLHDLQRAAQISFLRAAFDS
jgi:hypothetical protein